MMWSKLLPLAAILYATCCFVEIQAKQLKLQPITASEVRRLLHLAKRTDLIPSDKRTITKGITGRSINAHSTNINNNNDAEIRKLCFFSKISSAPELGRSASASIACKPQKFKVKATKLKLPWSDYPTTTRTNFASGRSNYAEEISISNESDYAVDPTSNDYTDELNDTQNDHEIGMRVYDDDDYSTYYTKPTTTNAAVSDLCKPAITSSGWSSMPNTGMSTTIVGYANQLPFSMPTSAAGNLLGLNPDDNALIASTGTAAVTNDVENAAIDDVADDGQQQDVDKAKIEFIHCISFEEEKTKRRRRSLNKFIKI